GLELSALDVNDEFLQMVAGDVSEGRLVTPSLGRWMPEDDATLREENASRAPGKASLALATSAVFLSLQAFAHHKGADRSTTPRTRRPRPTPPGLPNEQ